MTDAQFIPRVLAMRGRGFTSQLILWHSRGTVSHIAIEVEPGVIIESWQGAGVRKKKITDWSNVRAFRVSGMTPEQGDGLRDWLHTKIGASYDYRGVFGFVTRARQKDGRSWFCSELAFAGLAHVGVSLFFRTEAWEVSPSMLIRSPFLIEGARLS